MHREQEDEEVIGYGLGVAVYRVECVAGERSWDDPFMVGLVDMLVHEWEMQPSVDPVDTIIREE
jgi:hypothetical protein